MDKVVDEKEAISVLTKRKSFWFGSLGFGVVGVVLLVVGLAVG